MNFDLNDEQQMLHDIATRFASERYDLPRRGKYLKEAQGFSSTNWHLLGEIGLLGLFLSGSAGGLDASPTDIIVLFEALGRGLVVEPLVDCALLGAMHLDRGANPDVKSHWAADLVSGTRRVAYAHRELTARNNARYVSTRFRRTGDTSILSGEKVAVACPIGADAFVVSASHSEDPLDWHAMELFLVPADAAGLEIQPYRQIDGSTAGRLFLKDVILPPDAQLSGGRAAIETMEALASLARAAEALGIMETVFAATLAYLRERKQFGVTLASFQALQHRMVGHYVQVELSRSLLCGAAMTNTEPQQSWLATIAGTRAFIAEASVKLGEDAIQLHGGMGVSDELMIGHAHKRLLLLSRTPAEPAVALDSYARA